MSDTGAPSRVPLSPRERRVLGVLVEKAKTTPESYPLTVAALVTGSNQKSNRDPITNYDSDDVEDILQDLRRKGAVIQVESSGRVPKFKHTLYDWLKVNKVELAVLAELLLRGAQTEGDLRARASRMEPLPDLNALQQVLDPLIQRGLVVQISPPGQRRGVIVSHGLYPAEEFEKVRQHWANLPIESEEPRPARVAESHAAGPPAWSVAVDGLKAEIEELRATVQHLDSELRTLKDAWGA